MSLNSGIEIPDGTEIHSPPLLFIRCFVLLSSHNIAYFVQIEDVSRFFRYLLLLFGDFETGDVVRIGDHRYWWLNNNSRILGLRSVISVLD